MPCSPTLSAWASLTTAPGRRRRQGRCAGGRAPRAGSRPGFPPRGRPREEIERLLGEEDDAAELEAARALARRRRLGPWRGPAERAARREKDLAALARAGFGLDLARQVIDADEDGAADQ